jgi:peptidoglycan/xylan/chitin deacetylase (PgdA/CDA1 family)
MNELNIIMYHYVREIKNSKYPKIKGLEISGFRRQLDYFTDNFNIIKAEDVINFVKNGANLPERSCLLTFDDGYKDHLIFVLPELLKRNLQGSFFPPVRPVIEREILDVNRIHFILASTNNFADLVNDVNKLSIEHGITTSELNYFKSQYAIPSRYDTADVMYVKHVLQHALSEDIRSSISSKLFRAYVNRNELDFADELYLSFDETKKLIDSGMYVGSHGYRHLWLDKESYDSQLSEIDLSLKFLKDIGARTNNWIMCYPYGAYNKNTLRILTERNCAVGLTTKVGIAEVKRNFSLELSRFDTNDYPQ